MSLEWDGDIMDDLDDDLDDDLEDELEDGDLEDGGDELSGDDDHLEAQEVGVDYAVSDHDVQALSADRGAALMRPKILGSAVHLDGLPRRNPDLTKIFRGQADIAQIEITFVGGRKLVIKP